MQRYIGTDRAISLLAALLLGTSAQSAVPSPAREARTIEYSVDEGTDFSVTPSPDGKRLLIDIQGSLWTLPAAGGTAIRITPDLIEAMRGDWSPDSQWIAAQSYADGMWHIWLISADGTKKHALTTGTDDDMAPRWSRDGKRIAFLSTRGGGTALWTADPQSGAVTPWPGKISMPQAIDWAPDGQSMVLVDGATVKILAPDGTARALTTECHSGSRITGPSLSPDGHRLAYVCAGAQYGRLMLREADGTTRIIGTDDDVFPYAPHWLDSNRLLYTGNGKIRTVDIASGAVSTIPFSAKFRLERAGYQRKHYNFDSTAPHTVKGIVAPALSPDTKNFVFKALNNLWIADRAGTVRQITHDMAYESDPVWSPDGKEIAFASDASGVMQIHVMDLATGAVRQVTHGDHARTAPAWSPDGTALALQSETGDTRILNLTTGSERVLVPAIDFPSRPSWSADGKSLVFTALDQSRNRIAIIDIASGKRRWIDAAPLRSISTRGDDGPVWSPDGRWLAFSMMSTIWAMPIAPDGTPTGPAQQLTHEASDAPSWGGDSRSILYLANGTPKIVDRVTGQIETLAINLDWRPDHRTGETIVHAGRLWDGVNPAARTNVDIIVKDNRIVRITPHGSHAGYDHIIDASGLTVTPGLFEMHNHQQLRSKYLGDRQGRLWLAYGITSTRSTGDPVYRALEDKESLAAGLRIGPRHFMTGEMLEGSRPLWSFSRPIEDEAQLALELSRAKALGYDVLKTYMRFRSDWQQQVARFGHDEMGISATSHFSFPGVAHGVDGEEHLSGPTRWNYGFPHLFRGNLYADYFLALEKSGMELTTTNFAGRQALLELPGLPDDPRLRALYPAWEMASLKEFMGCAAKSGPCNFFLTPDADQSRLTASDLVRIIRGGGTVMIGSDAPLDSFVVSTFQNLYTLQKYGLSPFEALQAATITPARAQGVAADLGSIEAGKIADLVFVRGTPDSDVRDLMKVDAVMKAGRYFTVDTLIAPFAPAQPPQP